LHVLVVIVLASWPMMMVVVMIVSRDVIVMIMVVIVSSPSQELRLDVEDAVEVEGVAAEHGVERHLRSARCGAAWHRG
jgi:hypothetical protein